MLGKAGLALLVAAIAGCGPAESVPIGTRLASARAGAQSECLVVLLPGRGDSAETFTKIGFTRDMRARGVLIDAIAVNAHLGYYEGRTIATRLHDDVIAPARAGGYRHIFVVGVSMGGLGALMLAATHPGDVDGVLLIAPYLGPDSQLEEIERRGGLATWRPATSDGYARIWDFVRQAAPGSEPPIFLAMGERDRLARTHRLLRAVIDRDRVLTNDGRHGWAWWRPLWNAFLKRHAAALCPAVKSP